MKRGAVRKMTVHKSKEIYEAVREAEAIIFDIGNVLVSFSWEEYMHSLGFEKEVCEHVVNAMFRNEDWEEGDLGKITTAKWLELFIQNDPGYETQIRRTFENFGGTITPFEYTKPWIARLKQEKKKLYFLSNYSEEMYRQTKEKLDFLDDFDGGIFSWEEKCMKPDEKIYKILIDRYQLTPEKCVFFDDRAENVKAAVRAGMKGFIFLPDISLQLT